MKRKLLLATICVFSFIAVKAQKIGDNYAFKSPLTVVTEINFATKVISTSTSPVNYAKKGVKFKVYYLTATHVVFKIFEQSITLTSPTECTI